MRPDLVVLVLAQVAGFAVLLLLIHTAWSAYRLSRAAPLRRFLFGFGAFAIAQLIAVILSILTSTAPSLETRGVDHFDVLFWSYYAALILGAASIVTTFDRRKFKWVLALGPVLLVAGPILQVLVLALLFLIVIHTGLNHIERARVGSFQTSVGYFLLLVSHFAFLYGYRPLGPRNLLGELVSLAALIVLYFAARWPRGVEE